MTTKSQDPAVLASIADAERAEQARAVERLRALCPCPAGPDPDGPDRTCLLHGDPAVALEDARAALTFYRENFRRDAWEAGARWGRQVAAQPAELDPERVRRQADHYAGRVENERVMLSRCLGRLAGYARAAQDRLEAGETVSGHYRLPEFRVITGGGV